MHGRSIQQLIGTRGNVWHPGSMYVTEHTHTHTHKTYRESDLIIDNHMDRASHIKIWDFTHLHGFIDHALSGKGGISMQKQRHHIANIFRAIAAVILLGTGLASDHGIDTFQMRGICHQTQMNTTAIRILQNTNSQTMVRSCFRTQWGIM